MRIYPNNPIREEALRNAIKYQFDDLVTISNKVFEKIKNTVDAHNYQGGDPHTVDYSISKVDGDAEIVVYKTKGEPIKRIFGAWDTGKTKHFGVYHAHILIDGPTEKHDFGVKIRNYSDKYGLQIIRENNQTIEIQDYINTPSSYPVPPFSREIDIELQLTFLEKQLKLVPKLRKAPLCLRRGNTFILS